MDNQIIVKFIPATKWYKRSKWKLVKPYISHDNKTTVPTCFITDGASIPFFARTIFSPTGRYFGAAIVHDYIIVSERDFPKAHDAMEAEMEALNIIKWRKFTIMSAIRSYSWLMRLFGQI